MTGFLNGMAKDEIERLAILMEECGEVVLACGKILRHGYESFNPDKIEDGVDNRCDLEKELGDVVYAMRLMYAHADVDFTRVQEFASTKPERIRPYLHCKENIE